MLIVNLVLHAWNTHLISNPWQVVAVKASRIKNDIKVRFQLIFSWGPSKPYFCASYHVLDQTQLVIADHSLELDVDAVLLVFPLHIHVLAVVQDIVLKFEAAVFCK